MTAAPDVGSRHRPRRKHQGAGGRTGLGRVVGISASLVGTQAATSVLGLGFWALGARFFSAGDVGVAGAAVAMMMLLGSLGSLGLGTLLIARLPHTAQSERRVLVRTSLLAAFVAGAVLALVFPLTAVHAFGADNLRPLVGTPLAASGMALGTGLMSLLLVLDQAVLTIGNGSLQLERNIIASVVKIVALVALSASGAGGGMAIFLAWTIGSAVSLPSVSWRTRGGRRLEGGHRLVDLRLLRGLGRMAASHHALNIALQAPLQILPIMVTVLLSAQENAYFNSAVMVTGFVFALPYAVAISLFASAEGDARAVVHRMARTIPFGLLASLLAYAVLFPAAGLVLRVFGQTYAAEGTETLRVLALAGVAFVIKDHYIALRRVEGRTTQAVSVTAGFLVVELGAAAAGASAGGTVGLCAAWVSVLWVEALVLGVPLFRAWRAERSTAAREQVGVASPLATARRSSVSAAVDTPHAWADGATSVLPVITDGRYRQPPSSQSWLVAERVRRRSHLATTEQPAVQDATVRPRPTGREVRPASGAAAGATVATATSTPAVTPAPVPGATAAPGRDGTGRRGGRAARRVAAARGSVNLTGPTLLVMSVGVLLMALGASGSRATGPMGVNEALWVAGLAVAFLPPAFRVVLSRTSPLERTWLVISLPVVLQVSRLVRNPTMFTYHDELIHLNTLRQLDESGRLFSDNSLLPVSGFYPGLELVTQAVQDLTGLSAFVAGTVVLVLARVVLTLGVLQLGVLLTRSARAGAIAAVVYVLNSQFLFFNSQYSYQSLALPLAVLAVYLLHSRTRGTRSSLVLPVAAVLGVVLTHHVTSVLLTAALAGWLLVEVVLARRGPRPDRMALAVTTVVSLLAAAVAAVNPGNPVGSYLVAIVTSSADQAGALLGGGGAKAVFSNSAGVGPQPYEQVLLLAAVVLVLVSMVAALRVLHTSWRGGAALGVVFALLALVYPVIPGGHLTQATAEVGDRAAGFVFLGTGVVMGAWLWQRVVRWPVAAVVAVLATVTFLGNVVLGSGPAEQQLPGPYLISADSRSVDAANVQAAQWLAANVPPGTRVYGDRVSGGLAASLGRQYNVMNVSTGIDASRLILDPQFGRTDVALISSAGIRYVIVDLRLSNGLPNQDVYIENGEFGGQDRSTPVKAAALAKFNSVPGVDRVYDNGSLVIFDVRNLREQG